MTYKEATDLAYNVKFIVEHYVSLKLLGVVTTQEYNEKLTQGILTICKTSADKDTEKKYITDEYEF